MADILLNSINQQCNNINNHELADPKGYMFPDVEGKQPQNPQQMYSKNSVSVYSEAGQNSFHLNIVFNKRDQLEKTICHMYARFIQKRADALKIFRRRPVVVEGGQEVDLSMLITKRTLAEYKGESIAQFTANFAQDFEKERTSMKLYINSKARSVASALLDEFK